MAKSTTTKSVKKPLDFLAKRAKAGEKKEVTLEMGITVTVPVIHLENIPSVVLMETYGLLDEAQRNEAILWKTLAFFCTEEELTVLGYLTSDELNEALELANGGAEVPKS